MTSVYNSFLEIKFDDFEAKGGKKTQALTSLRRPP